MRWCVALALISTFLSPDALAAPKGRAARKKDKSAVKAGPNLDTGGDPAAQEKSEEGPYAPRGKTGTLAETEERKVEAEETLKARPRDKKLLYLDAVGGFGRAPIPAPVFENTTTSTNALGLVLGGAMDLSPTLTFGARIPWSIASIERADQTRRETTMAFGNPELLLEYRYAASALTSIPILFGLGLPLAAGEPDPSTRNLGAGTRFRVNQFIDAATGWRDSELYWPERIPVVLGIGVRSEWRHLEIHAWTKLVVGVNIGGDIDNTKAYTPLGELVLRPFALRNVTLAGLTYDFFDKHTLWAGLDAWMVYSPLEPIEFHSAANPPTDFQFVAEPRLGVAISKLRVGAGFIIPLGGRLADSGVNGVRLHLDYPL